MTASGKVISCKVDRPNRHFITIVRLDSGVEVTLRFPMMQRCGKRVTVKV